VEALIRSSPPVRWGSLGAILLNVMAAVLPAVSPAHAAGAYSEDSVKAAYLYRIAGYVGWPDASSAAEPFTIAVLGSRSIARELRHLIPGHLINNRPVEVREIGGVNNMGRPQILYVAKGYAESLRGMMPSIGSKPTLLITDEPDGLEAGSALNFLTIGHRVRFEVSLTAADRSHLKISSELLAVAVRVRGGRRQTRDGCPTLRLLDDFEGCCVIRQSCNVRAIRGSESGKST